MSESKNQSSIWSWLLNAMVSISGQSTPEQALVVAAAVRLERSNRLYPDRFHRLCPENLRHIISYLPAFSHAKMSKMSTMSKALYALHQEDLLLSKFIHLIAVDGEDNQNKAEMLLKQHSKLISKLILSQHDVTDAGGRHFTQPMSAYAYVFWAGDTRMCRMLEKYMDKAMKTEALKQCKYIQESGLEFTFYKTRIQHSKHFDFRPVMAKYTALVEITKQPITREGRCEYWLDVAKELMKVPTYVAQEYCSKQLFHPLSDYVKTLENLDSRRTVKFDNWKPPSKPHWFLRCYFDARDRRMVSPSLDITIYQLLQQRAAGGSGKWLAAGQDDLAAVSALCQKRTVDDRQQTLENLEPLESRSHLSFNGL